MDIEIGYADIIERCVMLSAYEGRDAYSADGESLYERVKITEKDKDAIRVYIGQGAQMIGGGISYVLEEEGEYEDDKVVWRLHADAARRMPGNGKAFVRAVKEALASHAMQRWLENKLPQSASSYDGMFRNLMESAVRIIKTKRKPTRPNE